MFVCLGTGRETPNRNLQRVLFVDGARHLLVDSGLRRRSRLVVVPERVVMVVVVVAAGRGERLATRLQLFLQVQLDLIAGPADTFCFSHSIKKTQRRGRRRR